MDEEIMAVMPLFRPDKLDTIAIASLVHRIKDTVERHVDAPVYHEQLRNPQIYDFFVRPIVDKIRADLLCGGTMFCLLAVRNWFWDPKNRDPAMARIFETRAMICESVAIKLIPDFDEPLSLARALTFDFYPLADGTATTAALIVPIWLRVSAIELAIHCEAKRLLANPAVVSIVSDLWNGVLVFDPYLHKSHRIPFHTREEMGAFVYGRRGIVYVYNFENTGLLKPSRLRVPKYRYWLKIAAAACFVGLYLQMLQHEPSKLIEFVFGAWAFANALDEVSAWSNVGSHLYFLSLWNAIDLLTASLVATYYALRLFGLPSTARDILAAAGIVVIPRVFAIFESNEAFSRMVISLRRMSIDLAMSWLVVMMFSVGFWVAFAYVLEPETLHLFSTPSKTAYELVKIMFGFTSTVWETWGNYSLPGKVALTLYLFLTQFVVRTMVTAVLSQSFSDITDDSVHEYHYLRAVNTVLKIKSEASSVFFFSPPLTLLEWFLHPLLFIVPVTWYLRINRWVLKATHLPILAAIFIYERLKVTVTDRQQRLDDSQRAQLHRQLRLSMSEPDRPPQNRDRARAFGSGWGRATTKVRLDDTFGKRTSSLALLEEVLDHRSLAMSRGGDTLGASSASSGPRAHSPLQEEAGDLTAIYDDSDEDLEPTFSPLSSYRARRPRRVFSSASSVLRANAVFSSTEPTPASTAIAADDDLAKRVKGLEEASMRIERLLKKLYEGQLDK